MFVRPESSLRGRDDQVVTIATDRIVLEYFCVNT